MDRSQLLRLCVWTGLTVPAIAGSAPSARELAAAVRQLGDPDFEAREAAYRRILDWGAENPDAILALLPAASDDPCVRERCEEIRRRIPFEARLRKVAARAGGHADLEEAAETLFEALRGGTVEVPGNPLAVDPSPVAYVPCDAELSELVRVAGGRKKEAVEMLLALLEGETEPSVQASVLWKLQTLGERRAAPAVVRYLRNSDKRVVCAAAHTLAHLKDGSVVPEALSVLADPKNDAGARQTAAWLIGVLQEGAEDASSAPAVAACLRDPDGQVASAAATALARLCGWKLGPDPVGEAGRLWKERLERAPE